MSSRRGHTLPELMVVLSLMGILLYVSERSITAGYEFYHSTSNSITLQRQALIALTRVCQDLALSHKPSINVESQGTPDSMLTIPYPPSIDDGSFTVNNLGALHWQSIVVYRLGPKALARPLAEDTTTGLPTPVLVKPRALIRYADGVKRGTGYSNYDAALTGTDDYVTNIEFIDPKTTSLDVLNNTVVPAREQVIARDVIEFKVDERVDTIDVQITIMLPGRVKGGKSLDHSVTLQTTAFPKN